MCSSVQDNMFSSIKINCSSYNCQKWSFLFNYCIRSISLLLFHILFPIPCLFRSRLKRCITALSHIELKFNILCFFIIVSAISALTILKSSVIFYTIWNNLIISTMKICIFFVFFVAFLFILLILLSKAIERKMKTKTTTQFKKERECMFKDPLLSNFKFFNKS